jgi:hypothetical protein
MLKVLRVPGCAVRMHPALSCEGAPAHHCAGRPADAAAITAGTSWSTSTWNDGVPSAKASRRIYDP